MEYRRLGASGLKLSALSYGSWVSFSFQLDEEAAAVCMKTAYDAGVNFFDNAEVYAEGASEEIMGAVLRRMGWGRDTYCVSSKAYWGGDRPTQRGLSRKHLQDACHSALRRLQVDYLDLFFCHRPDLETPIEETVRAMDTLVRQGKVLYWGTSEWSAEQIQEARGLTRQFGLTPPTMEQPQYNMLHRDRVEREYHRLHEGLGLGLTTWSPLASGVLTGKYNDGVPAGSRLALPDYKWLKDDMLESSTGQANLDKVRALASVAKELGLPLAQLSIAWCLKNPRVSTVILGATNVDQLKQNLGSLAAVPLLTDDVIERLEQVLGNRPVLPAQY